MRTRLLVMMHELSPHLELVRKLRGQTNLEIEHIEKLKEAFERLIDRPPDGLLTAIDWPDPSHLELLAAVEAFQLRIPVLILSQVVENEPLPFALSPFLTLLEPAQSTASLATAIHAGLAQKHDAEGPILRVVDYLQLAILGAQSVTLDLYCSAQQELHLELVGGDLWNAYRNDLDGEPAILPFLFASPNHVKVRPLQQIPFARTFKKPGHTTLVELRARQSRETTETDHERPTLAIDLEFVDEILQAAPADESGQRDQEEPVAGRVESLLTEGLEAALARNYDRALQAFEEAAALRPEDPRVIHNLQRIRQRLK